MYRKQFSLFYYFLLFAGFFSRICLHAQYGLSGNPKGKPMECEYDDAAETPPVWFEVAAQAAPMRNPEAWRFLLSTVKGWGMREPGTTRVAKRLWALMKEVRRQDARPASQPQGSLTGAP